LFVTVFVILHLFTNIFSVKIHMMFFSFLCRC